MNFVDFLFIQFIVVIAILGTLINLTEPYLPIIVLQTFRYGKHSYKGAPNRLVELCEIPKSYFRHFYAAALIWSILSMYIVINTYVYGFKVSDTLVWSLDLICGNGRQVRTNSTTTFIATSLLAIQCIRRFYETHFVQVFSNTSKINVTHYIVGHLHYIGALLSILCYAEGFVRDSNPNSLDSNSLNAGQIGGIALFLFAWYHQFSSNLILANLRKNVSGKVVTENHLIPFGGYFEYVSSPHMLFEVLMYVALGIVLQTNSSWLYVMLWVLTNQVESAWLSHKWYHITFPAYPKARKAIFPFLL